MLKKKPKVGDKVITGNPDCCSSEHDEGSVGIIISRDKARDWGGLVKVGKETWWHCRKCMDALETSENKPSDMSHSFQYKMSLVAFGNGLIVASIIWVLISVGIMLYLNGGV